MLDEHNIGSENTIQKVTQFMSSLNGEFVKPINMPLFAAIESINESGWSILNKIELHSPDEVFDLVEKISNNGLDEWEKSQKDYLLQLRDVVKWGNTFNVLQTAKIENLDGNAQRGIKLGQMLGTNFGYNVSESRRNDYAIKYSQEIMNKVYDLEKDEIDKFKSPDDLKMTPLNFQKKVMKDALYELAYRSEKVGEILLIKTAADLIKREITLGEKTAPELDELLGEIMIKGEQPNITAKELSKAFSLNAINLLRYDLVSQKRDNKGSIEEIEKWFAKNLYDIRCNLDRESQGRETLERKAR